LIERLAPFDKSRSTHSAWSPNAAKCSAVAPTEFLMFGSAPCSSRVCKHTKRSCITGCGGSRLCAAAQGNQELQCCCKMKAIERDEDSVPVGLQATDVTTHLKAIRQAFVCTCHQRCAACFGCRVRIRAIFQQLRGNVSEYRKVK
jgi:hypothetical protein